MLESPLTTPSGRAERSVPRLVAVSLLIVAAAIHVYEYFGEDVTYVAVLFLVSAFGLLVGAGLLLARAPRLGWLIGGLSALLTFIAYIISRGIGLPADSSNIGNWLQPDGVVSLVVEFRLRGRGLGLDRPLPRDRGPRARGDQGHGARPAHPRVAAQRAATPPRT